MPANANDEPSFLTTDHADGTDISAHPCHSCHQWLKAKTLACPVLSARDLGSKSIRVIGVIRGCDHETNYHNSESLFD